MQQLFCGQLLLYAPLPQHVYGLSQFLRLLGGRYEHSVDWLPCVFCSVHFAAHAASSVNWQPRLSSPSPGFLTFLFPLHALSASWFWLSLLVEVQSSFD